MIRLTEYTPTRVRLDRRDLEYLLPMVQGTGESDDKRVIQSITPVAGLSDEYIVRPGGYVGRLGLPTGAWVDIHSRFPFDDVIELIRRSGRLPLRVDRMAVPTGVEPFIVDVLAAAFVREVERLIAGGLAKGYVTRTFERPPYPGQIDIKRHLGVYAARPDRLVTTAGRISHDVEINRALALAVGILHRVRLPAETVRGVAGLGAAFVRVSRSPMAASQVAKIPLTRLTDRYKPALALAEVIIDSRALAPREERLSGASVLFNMPKVWESFVARWVAEEWGPDFTVRAPYTFDVTNDGSLRSEADVTVWHDGALVALYDAKYKWAGTTPSMGDVYQMVTYCTRLGIDEATLVYPGPPALHSFNVGGVRVVMRALPVLNADLMALSQGDGSS